MMRDRVTLVASGFVECECGRTKRIPKDLTPDVLKLYVSGVLMGPFLMPDATAVASGDTHHCDPAWLRAEVVRLRATVAKRDQKLREMGIGMARLKARGDVPVAAPGKFRAARIAAHRSFEDARTDLISSEGKAEIARLEATAASPACACCDADRGPNGRHEDEADECTCVEGCPNA